MVCPGAAAKPANKGGGVGAEVSPVLSVDGEASTGSLSPHNLPFR